MMHSPGTHAAEHPTRKSGASGVPAIDVEHVSFTYDGNVALQDVTFVIPEGSYVGIIGPNGGGKTTLLRIILGLLEPTEGSVRVFGESPLEARMSGRIGYVPQRITQTEIPFPSTVEEIVKSGRTPKVGIGRRLSSDDMRAAHAAMERTGVLPYSHKLIGNLSGGEKQKVFIARALAAEARILILDEPTTGVDISSKEQFYGLLRELNDTLKLTIIFVSHDIEVMTKEAKSVCCLNQKLLCCCSSHAFLEDKTLQKLYGEHFSFIQHTH